MVVKFFSIFLDTSMKLFFQEFSREDAYTESGFISEEGYGSLRAEYRFEDETLLREVRLWGAAALSCGLISQFAIEV